MEKDIITRGLAKRTAGECCLWHWAWGSSCGVRSRRCRSAATALQNRCAVTTTIIIETTVAPQVVEKPSENKSSLLEKPGAVSHVSWDCSGEIKVATRLTSSAYNSNFCMMTSLQNSSSRNNSWRRSVRHKSPSWERWGSFSPSSSLRQSVSVLKYSWLSSITSVTLWAPEEEPLEWAVRNVATERNSFVFILKQQL